MRPYEEGLLRPYVSVARGTSTVDTGWRLAAHVEAPTKGDSFYGAVSLDLKCKYVMLSHARRMARAFSHGLPWQLGAVSIASYRWPRRLAMQGQAVGVLHAARGVVPG